MFYRMIEFFSGKEFEQSKIFIWMDYDIYAYIIDVIR